MKKLVLFALMIVTVLAFVGCGNINGTTNSNDVKTSKTYQSISQDEAKNIMKTDAKCIIVDVRRQDEYETGHIPGAICIPNEEISKDKPAQLPDLEQTILVYCRSGRRSKEASQKLANMGYTNIYEFGGITEWTGEITVK